MSSSQGIGMGTGVVAMWGSFEPCMLPPPPTRPPPRSITAGWALTPQTPPPSAADKDGGEGSETGLRAPTPTPWSSFLLAKTQLLLRSSELLGAKLR